ncbi:AMP-binding protein [Sphingomonas psychrotolerans]|uniref:Long-chain-fatty-acid--CoA ligase n=1 Tax=Sphingomonas psychrotolerans TaxID=1327635 RepID=A0ABU3N7E9_9SPHN|nr:AMP-binding protein [Sphingomonas psychrotolerans]MDT8759406.1 AMP-binding protein [Sphingomonas psychrotolerans]
MSVEPMPQDDADRLWAERFWTRFYRPGVPRDIDAEIDAAGTMIDLFERDALRYADRVGFVSLGTGRTYGDTLRDAMAFAAWLQSIGVAKGDRVALMMPNCLQYPVALFGTLFAGAVVVNVNPLYTAPELAHQLRDSGAEVLVVMDMFAATFASIRGQTAVREAVVTGMGDMLGPLKGPAVGLMLRFAGKKPPRWPKASMHRWTQVMRRARRLPYRKPEIEQDDLAFLQYTGGTSGVAKGAMLSHRNVVANTLQGRAWVLTQIDEDELLTNVTLLPLYHIFSLTANLLMFMGVGGRNVLIANPRDTKRVSWILKKERFTGMAGVNTLFASLLEDSDFRARDFSALRLTIAGGMATHADVAARWEALTGKPLVEGYGLTECAPVVCIRPVDFMTPDVMGYTGTVGLPLPSTEVRMRRADGSWAGLGEPGELCVRGPQVMQGYWGHPEETSRVLSGDGWLATGDVGVMGEDGEVRLIDRIKDMILVSGFNVYPAEVEAVIATHPDVAEVAVVGVLDPVKGERIKAVIHPRRSLSSEAVRAHCRSRLTGYKVPSIVELRDTPLPKSNVGKVLRRELR